MKPHIYLFLVATFCSASLIAEPQPFSAVTLTDQEIETARLRMKVLRCSVTNNPKRYSGPIELQVSRSEKGVVVKYPPKTAKEFRNCVGGNPEKSDGVKAWFTETFPFHPWAGRKKISPKEIKALFEKYRVSEKIAACLPKKPIVKVNMTLRPTGTVGFHGKFTEAEIACLQTATTGADFPKGRHVFSVTLLFQHVNGKLKIDQHGETHTPSAIDLKASNTPLQFSVPKMNQYAKELVKYAAENDMLVCNGSGPKPEWLLAHSGVRGVGCTQDRVLHIRVFGADTIHYDLKTKKTTIVPLVP